MTLIWELGHRVERGRGHDERGDGRGREGRRRGRGLEGQGGAGGNVQGRLRRAAARFARRAAELDVRRGRARPFIPALVLDDPRHEGVSGLPGQGLST